MMEQQDNLTLKRGVTTIKNEEGFVLFHVELTPNMMVILDPRGVVIARCWLHSWPKRRK